MTHLYEFASLSVKLSEVIKPLDESTVEDFLGWRKDFQFVLTNMKETLGWSLDSSVFKRDSNMLRIENILLKSLVKLKAACLAMSLVDDISDRFSRLLSWFSASSYGLCMKEKADSFVQGDLSIIEYFSSKKERLETAYAAELARNEYSKSKFIKSMLDGFNPDSRYKIGFRGVDDLSQLMDIVFGISEYDSLRELRESQQVVINSIESEKRLVKEVSDLKKEIAKLKSAPVPVPEKKKKHKKECKTCGKDISSSDFAFCEGCYREWKSSMKKSKKANAISGDEEGSVSSISIFSVNQSSYLFSQHCIGGKNVKVMWDTGATNSFGTPEVSYTSKKNSKSVVKFANGDKEISWKKGLVEFDLEGKIIKVWVQIVKSLPTPVILGMDFMRNVVNLDLVHNKIVLDDKPGSFVSSLIAPDVPVVDFVPSELDYPCLVGLQGRLRDTIISWIIKFKSLESRGWVTTPQDLDIFDVKLKDDVPVFQNSTKFFGDDLKAVEGIVRKWYDLGIIRRSKSKYASRMLLVKKVLPDGKVKHRLVPHFVEMNKKIISEEYPLPIPKDCASRVTGRFKSIIDIDSAYLHCKATDLSSEVLAFTVNHIDGLGSHFEFSNVMPWSTKNAGRHLQRLVENMGKFDYVASGKKFSRNLLYDSMEAFQDDIAIHNDDLDLHIDDINELFDRMFHSGLVPSWSKCLFSEDEIKWCGLLVGPDGIRQDPAKVEALSRLRPPSSWKGLECLVGKMNWHRSHVPKYAEITKPIYDFLSSRSRRKFIWNTNCQRSFMRFVHQIKRDVVLRRLSPVGQIFLDVDMSSSNRTLAAVLIQEQGGKEVILGYASKKLGEKEINYGAPKLELMAIWFGLSHFEYEVKGRNAIVRSDHKSLSDLHFKNPKGIWASWLVDIMSFDVKIIHINGKDNVLADAISRLTDWAQDLNSLVIDDVQDRKRIIRRYHHHLSDRKTIQNIQQKYYWDSLSKDVQDFKNNCYYCLRNRKGGELRNKLISSDIPDRLWESFGIDVIPLLELRNGEKKSIAVIVDNLSNMAFMYVLENLKASEFIRKLKSKVFDFTGPPKVIIGDKAKQFLSADFESLLKGDGIIYKHSSADHHQGNAQVENRIKTLKRLLHSFLDEGMSLRSSIKETLHAANNVMVNDSRGFTPFHIVNGFIYEDGFDRIIKSDMEARSYAREISKKNLDKARDKQQLYYDIGKKNRNFKEGDWVMVVNKNKVKWNQDDLVGPYRVEKVLSNDNYLIHNHFSSSWNVYNIQQIGDLVDVSDSRFQYKFDKDSKKWIVDDSRKLSNSKPVVQSISDDRIKGIVADPAVREIGPIVQELVNQDCVHALPLDVVPSRNVPILGDKIKVFFQSRSGETGRNVIGQVIGVKDNNDFLVKWDKQKKPETVNMKPEDMTESKDNDERWSFI